MAKLELASDLVSEWENEYPGAFFGVAAGKDVDAAFDAAVGEIGQARGFGVAGPSLVHADPSEIRVVESSPAELETAAAAALLDLADGPVVGVAARAIAASSAHRRRNVRVKVVDPGLSWLVPGVVMLSPSAVVLAALTASGLELAEGETATRAEVVRARPRFKPVVTAFKGGTVATYVGLCGSTLVTEPARTAGEARRAAVASIKEMAGDDQSLPRVEIVKLTRRADGNPFVEVVRRRVAQNASVKVTVSSPKDPAKMPLAGWLFYGTQER